MESIIIANYPRSGARYLTALLCSRFNIMRHFDANQISLHVDDIEHHPETGMIFKTIDSNFDGSLPYKTIYSCRDPRDVMATFAVDDKIGTSELSNHTIVSWVSHVYDWINIAEDNEILFLSYEDMINKEEEVVEKLSSFLGIPSNPSNGTRDSELKAGRRPIGLYKEVFTKTHLDTIQENIEDCLEDLKEYL